MKLNKEVVAVKVEGAKSFLKKHGKKILAGTLLVVGAGAVAYGMNKKKSQAIDVNWEASDLTDSVIADESVSE